jgi:DNA polymerase-3 subunit alpha
MASVGMAMEAAEQAAANAMQGGLFDMFAGGRRGGPEYVKCRAWTERERLKEEKLAIGFFLSGHPFNASSPRCSRFVRRTLAQLEPRATDHLLAGVVMECAPRSRQPRQDGLRAARRRHEPREVSVFNEVLRSRTRQDRHRRGVDRRRQGAATTISRAGCASSPSAC